MGWVGIAPELCCVETYILQPAVPQPAIKHERDGRADHPGGVGHGTLACRSIVLQFSKLAVKV